MSERETGGLRSAGVKQLFLSSFLLLIQLLVFWGFARMLAPRHLLYFVAAFVHYVVSLVIQYRFNPALLMQRLVLRRAGSKGWDEILMRLSNLTMLIAIPAIAGLDVGWSHWPMLGDGAIVVGVTMLGMSTLLLNWAMVVNPYFEPTVRIQTDRGHRVIQTGPYRSIRHPGYLSAILFAVSISLIIGSMITVLPTGLYVLLILMRTVLEDRTLRQELDEYEAYARQVKYRLIPGLW